MFAVPVGEAVTQGVFSLMLQVSLNDSHNQMVVHWAGEKSNVIVALARDSLSLLGPKNSDVSNTPWASPGAPSASGPGKVMVAAELQPALLLCAEKHKKRPTGLSSEVQKY